MVPKPAMARKMPTLSHTVSFFIGPSSCVPGICVGSILLLHYALRALAVKEDQEPGKRSGPEKYPGFVHNSLRTIYRLDARSMKVPPRLHLFPQGGGNSQAYPETPSEIFCSPPIPFRVDKAKKLMKIQIGPMYTRQQLLPTRLMNARNSKPLRLQGRVTPSCMTLAVDGRPAGFLRCFIASSYGS
jgi:hypothetical protein